MKRIDRSNQDVRELSEALEGVYESYRMSNGIVFMRRGNFIHFSGFFNGTQEVVEIPKVPAKIPIMFLGDSFGCVAVAEANAGFVNVPETARRKKFVVMCDSVINI